MIKSYNTIFYEQGQLGNFKEFNSEQSQLNSTNENIATM